MPDQAVQQRWEPLRTLRRASWRAHAALLPLLHVTDPVAPANTCVNLQVLWLKALAGTRGETADYISYRCLPTHTRWIVSRPLCWLYPPWMHTTIARRSLFIDDALADVLGLIRERDHRHFHVVTLGAGFDTRPMRLGVVENVRRHFHVVTLGAGFDTRPMRLGVVENVQRRTATLDTRLTWSEVDLPEVIQQKRRMLERLTRRRPWLSPRIPSMHSADLSTRSGRRVVHRAAQCDALRSSQAHTTVFVLEALLMYMDPASARELLRVCGNVPGSLVVFADRLPGGVDNRAQAEAVLKAAGLTLDEWRINAKLERATAWPFGFGWPPRVRTSGAPQHPHQSQDLAGQALAEGDARALVAAGACVSHARHMGIAHSTGNR
jgi:O-methyltransferase involved in polyketide biosynthesis